MPTAIIRTKLNTIRIEVNHEGEREEKKLLP
jgi:hypothetical protein